MSSLPGSLHHPSVFLERDSALHASLPRPLQAQHAAQRCPHRPQAAARRLQVSRAEGERAVGRRTGSRGARRRAIVLRAEAAAGSSAGEVPDVPGSHSERSGPLSSVLHALGLLRPLLRHLLGSFWSIALAFALSDAAQFLVHRVSSRLVNACAQTFLAGQLDVAAIGNPWWMSNNPAVASFDTGYQYLAIACFILSYPLTILLRTAAVAAAILLCARQGGEPLPEAAGPQGGKGKGRRVQPLGAAVGSLRGVAGEVRDMLWRVWQVDLRVTVQAVPLQAASLLLLPLPWSLPRLLALMLATPAAVLEGTAGELAVERGRRLARRVPWQQALPYLALLLAYQALPYLAPLLAYQASAQATSAKGVGQTRPYGYDEKSKPDPAATGQACEGFGKGLLALRKAATEAWPQRFFIDVPELPALAYLAITLLAVVTSGALDLLPFTAFEEAKRLEEHEGGPAVA